MASKKPDIKTEKYAAERKNYKVTAINGETQTFSNVTYGEMVLGTIEFLKSYGLSYPLGIMSDGIKEV